MGILGGLLGMVPLGLLGVGVIIDPGDASRIWAPIFWIASSGFAPAIWLSIRPSPYRRPVQRATVVGCMVGAFVGSFVIITMPMVLLPSASILAIASGLIFQRS